MNKLTKFGQERIDEPTPNGGAYSLVFFYDAENNFTTPDKASKFIIQEYTKNGILLVETCSFANKKDAAFVTPEE